MISTESRPGNGSRTKGSVLVVDDNPDNLRLLTGILTEKGYKVRPAPSGSLALKSVQSTLPDLVLLDIKMPGMDGYEVCRYLKSDEKTRDVPVIFISALEEMVDKIKGFGVGGVDYITKPFQHEEVLARVKTHLSLRQMQKRLKQARNDLENRVRERTADLAQANEALRQSERKLAIRNRIAGIFLTVPDEEMYGEILKVILEVMKSKYGIFGYINEDGAFVCPSMTRDIWDQCRVPDKDIVFPRETWGGIWGRALIEKKTFYSNEPFRVPEGHIPITRALDVPIIHQEEVIGNLVVANKGIDYDDNDQAMLETIASHIAPILSARLQRDRQESARTLAEETLRESEEKYRDLADSLPQVVFEMDEKGIFTFVNRNAFDISGYTQSDFDKGFNAFQMLIPEDRDRAMKNMEREFRGESPGGSEYTAVRKDGSTFPVILHATPIWRDNKPMGLRGIVIDLTEQKKMEADLTRRAMAMEHSSDAIVITDTKGTITYVNPAFEKITGYTREDAIGENPRVLKSGKHDEAFYRHLWQTISRGKTWTGQFINKKKDGSHYTEEATISPVFSPSGDIVNYVAVKRDITDRKQAEEELKRSLKNLRKAMTGTIQAITLTVERRDPYTAGHQRSVSNIARAIATEMGLSKDQIDGIQTAGVIHDLGKIAVPAEILSKPGRITEHEFGIIKSHSQVGFEILKEIEFPWPIAQIVLQHHERMDGSGYPQGISGEDILLEARILAVADVVEAMSSHRPYRPALGIDKALEEIVQKKGAFYDRKVVDACLKIFEENGFEFESLLSKIN